MGIRFSTEDSTNLMKALNNNVALADQIIARLTSGSDHLINSLHTGELQGAAYTAGKGLFEELIIPAIQKLQAAVDDIKTELTSYEYAHSVLAVYDLLDRDILEAQLQEEKAHLRTIKWQLSLNTRFLNDAASSAASAVGYEYEPQRALARARENHVLRQNKAQVELAIGEIEAKINKLEWFVGEVGKYFSDSLEVLTFAIKGAVELHRITVDAQGYFTVPAGMELDALRGIVGVQIVSENSTLETIKMLQEVFGFSHATACDIQELMILMKMSHMGLSDKDLAIELMILFGSVSYGDTKGLISDNLKWDQATGKDVLSKPEWLKKLRLLGFSEAQANGLFDAIEAQHVLAGFPDNSADMKNYITDKIERKGESVFFSELIGLLTSTGMSIAETKRLVLANSSELHNKLAQFSNRPDFSHMMITGVAELNNDPQIFANVRTGFRTVITSGWLGDSSNMAATPSLGNDDYKADLDAVNIARRIKDGSGPFDVTLKQYYNEIKTGHTNRAKEFQQHYKVKNIINEINLVDVSGKRIMNEQEVNGEFETTITYDNSLKETLNPVARNFVNSLEQNSNDYIDEEPS